MKLHQGTFRLDVRKRFFTQRAVRHWNRLPTVMAQSLLLDSALRHMVCVEPGVGSDDPCGSLPIWDKAMTLVS